MRKILCLLSAVVLMTACQETLEQRAARELRQYTEKNCPLTLSPTLALDSMAFEDSTRTLHYYYRFMGAMDIDSGLNTEELRRQVLASLQNAAQLRTYKEAGYRFAYSYYSQKTPGKLLFEAQFSKEDYGK